MSFRPLSSWIKYQGALQEVCQILKQDIYMPHSSAERLIGEAMLHFCGSEMHPRRRTHAVIVSSFLVFMSPSIFYLEKLIRPSS